MCLGHLRREDLRGAICGAIASIASARHIAKGGFAAARRWRGMGVALAWRWRGIGAALALTRGRGMGAALAMTQRVVVTLCSVGRDLWIASFAGRMERGAEPGRDKPKGGFIAWRLCPPLVGAGGRMERKDAINRAREGRISSGAALALRWRGLGAAWAWRWL